MLKRFSTFLTLPVFAEDEDKTRKARYTHVIALVLLGIAIVFEAFLRIFANYTRLTVLDLSLFVVAAICLAALVLIKQGHVQLASTLLVVLTWLATNGLAATGFGAKDSSYIVNFAIILMAGLLLSWKASLIVTVLSISSGFALAYAEQKGVIGVASYPIMSFARDITVVFGLNGVLIYLLINGLESALRKSRKNLQELEAANTNLSFTQTELRNRTGELTGVNEQLENRTKKLQAIALVTRATASIQNFDALLASITSTISKELGYAYVALFLLDEQGEFAILRSTNIDSGFKKLSQVHRVPVGQIDPIGFVAQTGQPKIVPVGNRSRVVSYNVGGPATQSELVLPLKSGDQIIGVLDIQAAEDNVFQPDDVSILSILADQVGITIQNLLLYEQAQNALREADIASMQATAQSWKGFDKTIQTKGYRYDGIKSEPLKDTKQSSKGTNALSIPIQVRGQTIGRFKLNPSDSSREWSDDELTMVKATAERVALALEGARLLDEAQKRATREAFLSDVAAKLSGSFQLDSILRDTVQELGQSLKNSTVTFQLVDPSSTPPSTVESKRANGSSPE